MVDPRAAGQLYLRSLGQLGIWVRREEPYDPKHNSREWIELHEDRSFKVHLTDETYRGSYSVEGARVHLRANYAGTCTLAGDTLRCDDGPGSVFVRTSKKLPTAWATVALYAQNATSPFSRSRSGPLSSATPSRQRCHGPPPPPRPRHRRSEKVASRCSRGPSSRPR